MCFCLVVLLLMFSIVAADPVFRSYHPHYLHSYSYPQPSTLHMYYGRVMNNKPIFLIQQGEESLESQLFTVANQTAYVDAAKNKMRRQLGFQRRLDCMLVFSVEDSVEDGELEAARLEVAASNNAYVVVMVNGSETKAYAIQVTKNNVVLQVDTYAQHNLDLFFRNVSSDPEHNWRISRNLTWKRGANQRAQSMNSAKDGDTRHLRDRNLQSISSGFLSWMLPKTRRQLPLSDHSYSAIAFQISLPMHDVGSLRIHINEVPLENLTDNTTAAEIFKIVTNTYDVVTKRETHYRTLKKTCNSEAVDLLLKGLSFEYGKLTIVHNGYPVANEPKSLLSFSPSRKRFPWGFLWDDGFHTEVVSRNYPELALKVIKSWLDTMIDGWIPREQNRGTERVELCNCQMFMAKDDRDGNPPSLVMPLTYLLNSGFMTLEVLGMEYWQKIKQWHAWYMKTQMTTKGSYLFKWFDHIVSEGSFNSGMDDFPRPMEVTFHVDAQCWMYKLTKFMWRASEKFEKEAAAGYYSEMNKIKANLKLMLDPTRYIFTDTTAGYGGYTYSPHVGYGSLLPIAFGMLEPNTPQFNATLSLMSDPTMLNSSFGLSSIAANSPYYLMNRDAYWRGPVWINMNYLALRGLKLHYQQAAQKVYTSLRYQLIKTVCGQWERTGYFYENYIKGRGSFSYPFNGWTSLIALIVTEEY